MYNEMMEKVLARSPGIPPLVVKLNKVAVAHFERFLHLQLDAYKAVVELSLDELKSLAEVSDADSFRAFWLKQTDVARAMRDQRHAYAKALTDLGDRFDSELQKMTRENVKMAA
jgi:phasin family protein